MNDALIRELSDPKTQVEHEGSITSNEVAGNSKAGYITSHVPLPLPIPKPKPILCCAEDSVGGTWDDNGEMPSAQDDIRSLANEIPCQSQNEELSLPSIIRFSLLFGQAALLYGSPGTRVESFLETLVSKTKRFHGNFFVTNSELIASVWVGDDDVNNVYLPTTVMVKAPEGMNMHKLMLLSELAKDIVAHRISVEDAVVAKLPEIKSSPDPFGPFTVFLFGYVGASTGLAVLLGGTWWDVMLASIGGAICWATLMFSEKCLPAHCGNWTNAACAFFPAILATAAKLVHPEVNVTIVTLSSVAIPLPGYTISHGLAEIIGQRVTRGIGHLVKGVVTLLQLVMGSSLGVLLLSSFLDIPASEPGPVISPGWLGLFVSLLGFALVVAFQVSYRDSPWTLAMTFTAFATTYASAQFVRPNLGTFIAATVVSLLSNIWSQCLDRPQSIVQVPSTVILVSGSIGFQGLAILLEGETFLGAQQFLQMIIVALLIVAGEYTGNMLVRPESTL
jgi:uncharacterized membrane protein YjjP (DUF1212 family)